MKTYTYYKLAFGGYMVAKNNEPLWKVNTRRQAIQDCKDLELAE
jgi:hypothetical protein